MHLCAGGGEGGTRHPDVPRERPSSFLAPAPRHLFGRGNEGRERHLDKARGHDSHYPGALRAPRRDPPHHDATLCADVGVFALCGDVKRKMFMSARHAAKLTPRLMCQGLGLQLLELSMTTLRRWRWASQAFASGTDVEGPGPLTDVWEGLRLGPPVGTKAESRGCLVGAGDQGQGGGRKG